MKPEDLMEPGPAAGAKARVLVAHMDGALDAGSAGGLALTQLLQTLDSQRVATFDSDQLIDFRSHRPVMQVDEWVTKDVSSPEIVIDLVHDDQGQPILLLHGPEPDAKWNMVTDAIREIADEAGVETVFALHGLPAAVPHTRPTTIHVQSTEPGLIPDQPLMGGVAEFPAPYTSFLQHRLQQEGRVGITLLATVPYYMAGATFPRASSALLRRLGDLAGLSLPIGDLERGADEEAGQVNQLVEQNHELQNTVAALEHHFDMITSGPSEGAELDSASGQESRSDRDQLGEWERVMSTEPIEGAFPESEQLSGDGEVSLADTIGDAIESYLRMQSKRKRRHEGN